MLEAVSSSTGRPPDAPPAVVAGPYLADLLAQPDSFRAVKDSLVAAPIAPKAALGLRARNYRRVVLTGMGSSFYALYPLHLYLSARGVASFWVETSELLLGFAPLRSADTLLVAVSQSGESAEIVSLLRQAGEFGHVVGVTNNPASTLARKAAEVLLLHAGVESTVSCKTYVATLAVLHVLAAALTGGDHRAAVEELGMIEPGLSNYLGPWERHVASLGPLLVGVSSVFVTGRGVSLATAGTGGLILKESTRRHAEGMSSAAFRHGPLEMIGPEVLVLVMAGDDRVAPLHRRLVADIVLGGGKAVLLASGGASADVFRLPEVPASLLPLVEILPVQMLSLALAARDGREAGRFERATKITVTD